MGSFLKSVLATLVAVALLFLVFMGVAWLKWGRPPQVDKGSILVQTVGGEMPEYPPGGATSGILVSATPTLQGILTNLDKAAVDKRIHGVLITLESPGAGYGKLEEVRDGIARVRKAGKPVWAWADVMDLKALYVASACDSLFLFPNAYVELDGMFSGHIFLKDALHKLGMEPQIHRIARFKSAAEMVTRSDLSGPAREMTRWILGDIYPHVIGDIAEGFSVDTTAVTAVLEKTVLNTDDMVAAGLASGSRWWDEMKAALPRPGGKDEPRLVAGADYARIEPGKVGLKGKKKIAVVHAQGYIGGQDSGYNPLLGMTMGRRTVNRDLKRAMDDDDVAAIVFRIDSGGGSSLTSDRIGRMVGVAAAKKPVIVSMADVAASGGYSIAYRATTLVADGNTITGSIGSITGKFVMKGFYDKLGVTKDGVGIGPNPDFYSDYRPWTPAEYAKVEAGHWDDYDRWIADIAAHRGLTPAEVDSVGRGRVWTGRQALDRKLVDRLGDLHAAIEIAKEAAKIPADKKVTVVHYPQPRGLMAQILGTPLGVAAERWAARWVREQGEETARLTRGDVQVLEVPVP
jgi:protease-4